MIPEVTANISTSRRIFYFALRCNFQAKDSDDRGLPRIFGTFDSVLPAMASFNGTSCNNETLHTHALPVYNVLK